MLCPTWYIVISTSYFVYYVESDWESETELLKVNERAYLERLKLDVGVEWPSWQGKMSRVWVFGMEWSDESIWDESTPYTRAAKIFDLPIIVGPSK